MAVLQYLVKPLKMVCGGIKQDILAVRVRCGHQGDVGREEA